MSSIFKLSDAKLKNTVVDFDTYLSRSVNKAFGFGINYTSLATKIGPLKEAIASFGINLIPTGDEEKQHKKWISDVKKRMLTSTQAGPDRVFCKEIIRRADTTNSCASLDTFFKALAHEHIRATNIIEEASVFGVIYGKREREPERPVFERGRSDPSHKKTKAVARADNPKALMDDKPVNPGKLGGLAMCNGCGMNNHAQADCQFKDVHPDYNTSALSWAESESGKACAAHDMQFLNWRKRSDGTAWQKPYAPPSAKKVERAQKYGGGGKKGEVCDLHISQPPPMGEHHTCTSCETPLCCACVPITCELCEYAVPTDAPFINLYPISLLSQVGDEAISLTALVDTGARSSNYVNDKTLVWLRANGALVKAMSSKRVCTAFNNCREVNQLVEVTISYKNVITNSFETISFEAVPLHTSRYYHRLTNYRAICSDNNYARNRHLTKTPVDDKFDNRT